MKEIRFNVDLFFRQIFTVLNFKLFVVVTLTQECLILVLNRILKSYQAINEHMSICSLDKTFFHYLDNDYLFGLHQDGSQMET